MKILLASSEIYPFAKTGGLADVAGSLPKALRKKGIDVRTVMPRYTRKIDPCRHRMESVGVSIEFEMDGKRRVGFVDVSEYDDVPAYFIDEREFFDRDELYGTPQGDYPDNWLRFAFFARAVLEMLPKIGFEPDIIHLNDWQTALVPVYQRHVLGEGHPSRKPKTLLTIHNLAYQGIFQPDIIPKIGLPEHLFNIEGLEFYGKVNYLKGGIVFSDAINTVSPTYAKEIQTPEFGYGLEGILKKRADSVFGILNGIDYEVWNPLTDQNIFANYDERSVFEGKRVNKCRLLEEKGLDFDENVPLIGIVSRLAAQKGFDILADAMNELAGLDLQFVILGTGDKKYQDMLVDMAKAYPQKFSVTIGFDPVLARKIYAGADMFLMPSRYEPCGLGQLIALRYGTIPIARRTGGLADTIIDADENPDEGYGFLFDDYSAEALIDAVGRALSAFKDRNRWEQIVQRGMQKDFSWDASAEQYIKLYEKLLKE